MQFLNDERNISLYPQKKETNLEQYLIQNMEETNRITGLILQELGGVEKMVELHH